jgi:acyl dehydratase
MSTQTLAAYEVKALNIAASSENRIHDDTVARRFGFRGALVPGVAVYAYMMHLPVARWGRAWLEGGEADCRFLKPVYDGAVVRVTAEEHDDGISLLVESAGERCATGHARLPREHRPAPAVDTLPLRAPPAERPEASETSLAPGLVLGITPSTIDGETLGTYLDDISEIDPIYRSEGLLHPGQVLRLANQALLQNVVLGPWIHVGHKVRHYSAARVGEQLTLRAKITSNTVSKGHAFVEFDATVVASGIRAVAEINYSAIWRPRQVADQQLSDQQGSRS